MTRVEANIAAAAAHLMQTEFADLSPTSVWVRLADREA